ncbi:MAG: hypothetical protein ABI697_00330 [Devosia sp.]
MKGLSRDRALQSLRARIESIEKRPPLGNVGGTDLAATGLFALPAAGAVHEVFADTQRDAGAALGFALAASRGLLTPVRRALLIVQLARDGRDLGVPYGVGIAGLGLDPENVVFCRAETTVELLWAVEEAIACAVMGAVVVDLGHEVKALDFTASRRLSLRATAGGGSVFVVRFGREREATAARFRWRVSPVLSGAPPFDARAPGPPRWMVELEKGRLGSRRDASEWMVDWTENGFVRVDPKGRDRARPAAGAGSSLPGAHPAALGDRLSEAS